MEKRTKHFFQKYFAHRIFGEKYYGKIKFYKILLKYRFGGEYEISGFLKNVLNPGDVFFDVGANMGQYSIRIGGFQGGKIRIYAFEPSGICADLLNKYFRGSENIYVEHMAVSDFCGNAELTTPVISGIAIDTQGTINPLSRDTDFADYRKEEVKVTTIDEYVTVNRIACVNCIKSDTEGEDSKVIMGAKDTIARFHPIVITEDILSGESSAYLCDTGYSDYCGTKDGYAVSGFDNRDGRAGVIKDVVLYIHRNTAEKIKKFIL